MMAWITAFLLFGLGIVLIVKGGDIFVDAAVWISKVTGIPTFIVGATIVSLATTLPELLVSLLATAQGSADMAIGNAIGSVAANTGLIMSISIIVLPAVVHGKAFWQKSSLMMAATLTLFLFSLDGRLDILESVILLSILGMFVYLNLYYMKNGVEEVDPQLERVMRHKPSGREIAVNGAKFVLGTLGIIVGAKLLVTYGEELAKVLGVPDRIIGITLVAVGTSLPELITTLSALAKKESSLSVGNIIGANIIDMTLILSSCAFLSGGSLAMSSQNTWMDLPATVGMMLLAIVPTYFGAKLRRWQGFAMMGTYVAYVCIAIAN